jgi:hypothetical protein
VESDLIKSVGYNEKTRTLEVRYSDSTIFQYLNVPSAVAHRLQTGKNIGSWWLEHWNDYDYKQVR